MIERERPDAILPTLGGQTALNLALELAPLGVERIGADPEAIRDLLGRVPLFGICLGHQLISLALDHETFKLPFGHRGANHPVRDVRSGRVLVTVQNHGFAVEEGDGDLVTHVSLNDGTVEGFAGDGFATVQFHPEAAPGPLDALPFFEEVAATCRDARIFARS